MPQSTTATGTVHPQPRQCGRLATWNPTPPLYQDKAIFSGIAVHVNQPTPMMTSNVYDMLSDDISSDHSNYFGSALNTERVKDFELMSSSEVGIDPSVKAAAK